MFTPLMATSVPEGWGRMQAKHPSLLAWKNSHIPNLSREPLSRTPRLPLQDPQGPTEDGQGARAGCPQCNILCPPEAGVGAWIWQHSTTLPVLDPGKALRWVLELLCGGTVRYLLMTTRMLKISDIQAYLRPQFPLLQEAKEGCVKSFGLGLRKARSFIAASLYPGKLQRGQLHQQLGQTLRGLDFSWLHVPSMEPQVLSSPSWCSSQQIMLHGEVHEQG